MNPRNQQYIKDIYNLIESVPYGDINLSIKRVDRKTAQLSSVSEETLRYVNNQEALTDLHTMLKRLIEASFTGEAHIKLEMKDGQIRIIAIFDKKDTKY
jgi:hypothetical protein